MIDEIIDSLEILFLNPLEDVSKCLLGHLNMLWKFDEFLENVQIMRPREICKMRGHYFWGHEKSIEFVDLVEHFPTDIWIASIGVDTAENGPFQIFKIESGCPGAE